MSRFLQPASRDYGMLPWSMMMDVPALFESELPIEEHKTPRCDIFGTPDDHTVINLEVPGFKKENIEVRIKNDLLIVEGKYVGDVSERTWKLRERPTSGFRRTFRVPAQMDPNQIKTKLQDGILSINLPELQNAAPRGATLAIESAESPAGAA